MKTQLRLLKNIVVVVLFTVAISPPPPPAAESRISRMPDNVGWFPFHEEIYELNLGIPQEGSARTGDPVLSAQIHVPSAPWLRLFFGDHHLGEASYLTITSTKDNARQHLTAKSLAQSGNVSAFFNGDMVTLELHAAAGEAGVFLRVEKILVGELVGEGIHADRGMSPTSLCGTDSRVASTDDRVGRLSMIAAGRISAVCTAWLTSNGVLLTAGHCVDWDPDEGGPGLPDGVLDIDANDVIEFNVPASQADGTPVFSAPDDQYPINLNSVSWHFDGVGQGKGKDWAVFGALPNANTGLRPPQAQGAFFRMTRREGPPVSASIRITGYGVDDDPPGSTGTRNAQNFTQQADTGPYVGEYGAGANIWHEYQVDTQPASSGSPIIWETMVGVTIGIHTTGGCDPPLGAGNSGTSFEHDPLENALQTALGANVVYVDRALVVSPVEDGSIFQPFHTVTEGIAAVADGGTVAVVAGSYNDRGVFNTPAIIIAPVGTVTIGR